MNNFEANYQNRMEIKRKEILRQNEECLMQCKKSLDDEYQTIQNQKMDEIERQMKQRFTDKQILPEVFEDVRLELELEKNKALNASEEFDKFKRIQDLLKD